MGYNNENVRFDAAGLGSKTIEWAPGREVVVYARSDGNRGGWSAHQGTVVKAARVNITVEFGSRTMVFRKDTQEGMDVHGKARLRTLEQDELDHQAKEGLVDLAKAGVILDMVHSRGLDAARIVALATTVRNHHSFRQEA